MLISVCDDDHPSKPRRIGPDTRINSAKLPLLALAQSQPSPAVLLGDCDDRGFALALLLYVTTWPIEEMPHDNVAGFCLAMPWMSYVSAAFRSASLRD
jgi:hypothetical protein